MHILKARIRLKLETKTSGEDNLKIIESGEEDGYPYVKLNSGEIFFHRFFKSPLTEIYTRNVYSHYEIDQKPHPKFGIHLNHVDNLLNLKVDENTKKNLLDNMPVKEGDVVLELGAFCGFGTMKLSKLVGEKGKIIAVEAEKINFKILEKNIQSNKIKNVVVINKGIWNKKGKLALFKEFNQRNSLVADMLKKVQSQDEIEVDTVDNILSELNVEKVDFVIMEINAAEIKALEGMKKTLSQNNIRLVSSGWSKFEGKWTWKKIKEILTENGFSVYIGVQKRVFAIKQ